MKTTKLCFALLLTFTLAAHAKDKKPKSDWATYFGAGISPAYPLSGSYAIEIPAGYNRASYTDAQGHELNVHCSTDDGHCAEGVGANQWFTLTDGGRILIGPVEPEYNATASSLREQDILLSDRADVSKTVYHARWKDAGTFCVQIPDTASMPDGKAKKHYAQHHALESCYVATDTGGNAVHHYSAGPQ